MHPVNSLKPIMAAALVMTALPIQAQQPSADASLDTRRSYDIPSLQLGSSLARIARESGQPISIDADLVRHLQAPPVQGRYTPEQAARAALAGSDLWVVRTPSGGWSLQRAAGASKNGAATLPEVRVTAQADTGATTEGTGSYAAMGSSSTATPLALTYKETPQSLTVLTRQRLDDQKLDNVMDALEATTGITAFRQGMGTDLSGLWSRGFNAVSYTHLTLPTKRIV